MHLKPLAVILVTASLFGGTALARDSEKGDDIDARLDFLEARIATQRLHAEIWWKGWLAFYSIGAVVQGVRITWADSPAERADLVISSIKASGGAIRYLVDPYIGIRGLDPAPYGAWGESKAARLERAEDIARRNAEQTNAFGPWFAHLINLGVNGTGAIIVGAGFDDWEQGLISAAIGFGVGEVALFTAPWEADSDLREYQAKFHIRATGSGGELVVAF